MAISKTESSPFQRAWKKAIAEYNDALTKAGRAVNLEEQGWQDIRDVDDLIGRLSNEHSDFDADNSRGSTMSGALKAAFGPLTLLMVSVPAATNPHFVFERH